MLKEGEVIKCLEGRGYKVVSFYYPDNLIYVLNKTNGCTYPLFKRTVKKWMEEDGYDVSSGVFRTDSGVEEVGT